MTDKEVFDLAQELLGHMDIAAKEAKGLKINPGDSEFVFVHIGNKEYVNPKYLSFVDHYKIVQLGKFLRNNPDVDDKVLKRILTLNKSRFSILIDVCEKINNLVQEIKSHDDEKYIPYYTSDWDENDSTAKSYIKNRTHYEKIIEDFS